MSDEDNIWGSLEAEFEAFTPAHPPVADTGQQVLRKMTIVDRFHRAIFSGWLYGAGMLAATTCCLILVGVDGSRTGYNPAVASLLPGLMVVLILAPLLAQVRKPIWRYALLGPLLAGPLLLAQPATISLILEFFSSGKSSVFMHLNFWDFYLEQYLSWRVWGLSSAASASIAWWILRRQRALPWFESPTIPRWRVIVALSAAVLPLSMILIAQPVGRYLLADRDMDRMSKLEKVSGRGSEETWKPVFLEWKNSIPTANDLGSSANLDNVPSSILESIESESLLLLKNDRYLAFYQYFDLRKLLLRRLEELQHPALILEELLRTETETQEYEFSADTPRALADYLQIHPLDRNQLTVLLKCLQDWHKKEADFVERMDRAELRVKHYLKPSELSDRERLKAFGHKVLISPPQVYYLWQFSRSLHQVQNAWEYARTSSPEQRREILHDYPALKKMPKKVRSIWYEIEEIDNRISQNFSGEAQILAAARLYKLDHGTYPTSFQDLTGALDFTPDPQWKIQSEGKSFTLISSRKKHYDSRSEVREWRLQ